MLVEMFAIPVLMQAVDFLFGEVKEILDERRAARQSPEARGAETPEIPLLDQGKEAVLKRKVQEETVRQKESAIQGALEEIEVYRQNYQRLKKRVALEGGLDFAPLSVVNQLHAQEDAILEISQQLAVLLESLSEQTTRE